MYIFAECPHDLNFEKVLIGLSVSESEAFKIRAHQPTFDIKQVILTKMKSAESHFCPIFSINLVTGFIKFIVSSTGPVDS